MHRSLLLDRPDERQDGVNLLRGERSWLRNLLHFVGRVTAAGGHALANKIIAPILRLLGAEMHNFRFHQLIHLGDTFAAGGVALLAELRIQGFSGSHVSSGDITFWLLRRLSGLLHLWLLRLWLFLRLSVLILLRFILL